MKKTILFTMIASMMLSNVSTVYAEEPIDVKPVYGSYEENSDEVFAQYVDHLSGEKLFSEGVELATSKSAYKSLNETDQMFYDLLLEEIKKVADGESADGRIVIPFEKAGVTSDDFYTMWNDLCSRNFAFIAAIFADQPYECYWIDKVVIDKVGGYYQDVVSDGFRFSFSVSRDFCTDDETKEEFDDGEHVFYFGVNTSKITSVPTAINNAKAIVEANKSKSDYEKLRTYANEICALTDYNNDAASNTNTPYGNPWQLIYVFDNDPATKVVCEGYSKAFQYLCDLSTFTETIEVVNAAGNAYDSDGFGGPHMFNIVSIKDEGNFLTDITNSDGGSTCNYSFFMRGATGSLSTYYTVTSKTIPSLSYVYDSSTTDLLADYITLSNEDYCDHTWTVTDHLDAKCNSTGYDIKICKKCSKSRTFTLDFLPHDTDVVIEGEPATCSKTGLTEGRKCSKCDSTVVQQKKIDYLPHTPVTDEGLEPTCTKSGYTEGSHCDVCGTVIVAQKVLKMKDHQLEVIPETPATCSKTGLTEGTKCTVCKNIISGREMIAMLPHTEVIDPQIDPTCTSEGLSEGSHCGVCGTSIKTRTVLSMLEHDTNVVVEGKPATCHETGYTEARKCSMCGGTFVQPERIDYLPHTPVVNPGVEPTCHSTGLSDGTKCSECGTVIVARETLDMLPHTEEVVPGVEPTCRSTGLTDGKKCSVCDTTIVAKTSLPMVDHKYGEWTTTGEAGCTTGGTRTRKCIWCSRTESEEITPTGHVWNDDYTIDTEATCTSTGTKSIHCKNCSAKKDETVIPVTSHSFKNYVFNNDATCTVDGTETAKCETCTKTDTRDKTGSKLGHDYKAVVTAPTCTDKGYTTHTCSRCKDSYKDSETAIIDHTFGEWKTVGEASCETGGTRTRTCSMCQKEESETITPTGHEWNTEYTPDTEPTCTSEGSKSIHCKNCSATKDVTVIEALGHEYGSYVNDGNATCTENGTETAKCERCDDTDIKVIENSALGHDYSSGWEVDVKATCTTVGSESRHCSRCDSTTEARTIEATGHTETVKPEVEATCTKTGLTEGKYCSVCGTVLVEQKTVATIEHEYKSVVTEPTCTAKGYTTHTCSRCNDSYKDNETAKTGHNWNSGTITKEPTDTSTGLKTYTCTTCNDKKEEELPKTAVAGQVKDTLEELKDKDTTKLTEEEKAKVNETVGAVLNNAENITTKVSSEDLKSLEELYVASNDNIKATTTGSSSIKSVNNAALLLANEKLDSDKKYSVDVALEEKSSDDYKVLDGQVATVLDCSMNLVVNGTTGKELTPTVPVEMTVDVPSTFTYETYEVKQIVNGELKPVSFTKNADGTLTFTVTNAGEICLIHVHNSDGVLPAVAATCTKTGLTAGKKCTDCGTVTLTRKTVAKKAHSFTIYDKCSNCTAYASYINTSVAKMTVKSISKAKGAFTVKWKKNTKVDGYEVRYSLKPTMASSKKVTISKNKTTSKKIKGAKKTKYYVQIRAFKKINGTTKYSPWSAIKNVTTK